MARTASPRLFNLIKAMTKSEKRYFSIFATRHIIGSSNKYVELFNAIDHQREFDPEALKELMYNSKDIKTNKFTELTSYLYDLILRSLRAYNEDRSMRVKVRSLLLNVEILFNKSLYENCKELLKKAQKLAEQYEDHSIILEILDWEKKIAYAKVNVNYFSQKIEEIYQNELKALGHLEDQVTYWKLFFNMYAMGRTNSVLRSEHRIETLNKLMDHPLLTNSASDRLFYPSFLNLRIYSLHDYLKGDMQKFFDTNLQILNLLQSNKIFIEQDPSQYISVLTNIISVGSGLVKHEDINHYLDLLKATKVVSYDDMVKKTTVFYLSKLSYCIASADFENGVALIKESEKERKKLKANVFESSFFSFYGFISFGQENYDDALFWLDKVQELPDVRQDLQSLARIVTIIIHYQLGNTLLLEYLIRSTYRFLKKRDILFEFEKLIIRFFRKSSNVTSDKELVNLFEELKNDFEALGRNDRTFLESFDFISWLESRIEGRSMRDIVKSKFLAKTGNVKE